MESGRSFYISFRLAGKNCTIESGNSIMLSENSFYIYRYIYILKMNYPKSGNPEIMIIS